MSGGANDIVLDQDALARFMSQIKDPEEKKQVRETAKKVPVKKMNQINRAPKKTKMVQSLKKKNIKQRKKVARKPKPEKVQFTAMYIKKGGRGRKTFTFEATDNITIEKLKTVIAGGLSNELKSKYMMLTLYDIPLTHGTLKDCGIQDEVCLFITDIRTNYTNELDALAGMMRERKSEGPKQARIEQNVADALTGFLGDDYGSNFKKPSKKKKSKVKPQTNAKTSGASASYGSKLAVSNSANNTSAKKSARSTDKSVGSEKPFTDEKKIDCNKKKIDYNKYSGAHLKKLLKERGIEIKTWDRDVLIQALEEDDAKTAEVASTSRDTAHSVNPSPPATPKVPPPGLTPLALNSVKPAEKETYKKPIGKNTQMQSKKVKKPKKAVRSGKIINMPYKSGATSKIKSKKSKGKKAKKEKTSSNKDEKEEECVIFVTYHTAPLEKELKEDQDEKDEKSGSVSTKPPERPPPLPVVHSKSNQQKPVVKAELEPQKPSRPPPVPVSQTEGPPAFVPQEKPSAGPPPIPQPSTTTINHASVTTSAGNTGAPPPVPQHIMERSSKPNVSTPPSFKKPEVKEQEKKLSKPKTKVAGAKRSVKKSGKDIHIIVQLGIGKSATVEDMIFRGQVHGSDVKKMAADRMGVESSKIKLNRANLPIWDTDYLNDGDHITAIVEKVRKERKEKSKLKTEKVAKADLVRMWDKKAADAVDEQKDVPDDEYGMPKKNTKTYKRMLKAKAWAAKKLEQLYTEFPKIPNVKILSDGTMTATFGDIFEHYQHIDTVIVGTLQSAKKKKLASFDNKRSFPLLQQRIDDHVVVTLFARQ